MELLEEIYKNASMGISSVTDLINDIEELRNKTITLEDKTLLDSLQSRYDLLSAADKSKVTNYNLLQQKYREYNELLGISDIIYNLMKYANEFFGNDYVISDPPHETSFNKTVLILILCFVITMFIILIIISTIFRIKYFKNNSLNEELNSKSDTSQTSFADLI